MTETSDGKQQRPRLRKYLEAVGWILLIALLWGTDLLVKLTEAEQFGSSKSTFRLVSEQITSGLAALLMVPFAVRWLRLFPLARDAWVSAIVGHTAGTVLFAFGHYSLMVAFRYAWYAFVGFPYIWRTPFVANLFVEYQKDIKVYLGMLAVITAYRYMRRAGRNPGPPTLPADGRLFVQTGRGDALLRFDEIDYLEGARNYVTVHAGDREYVVRDTLANLQGKLSAGPFVRTHRSYIVNLDRVREIRCVESVYRVQLRSGREVPLSRAYRDAFKARFSA